MSADHYLEQAEACRLERHRLEKYDSFFKIFCVSFEEKRLRHIISLYDKAYVMYLEQQNTQKAGQCAFESGYLCQYLREYNKAACKYVDAIQCYYTANHYALIAERLCDSTLKMLPLLDFKTKTHVIIECCYVSACLAYDNNDFNACSKWLTKAIQQSLPKNFTQIIKVYEKMVFLHVVKMQKPALAITLCEEIVKNSEIHAGFYKTLIDKLHEKKIDESCNLLVKLQQ